MAESQTADDDAPTVTTTDRTDDDTEWDAVATVSGDDEYSVEYRVADAGGTEFDWDVQYCHGSEKRKQGIGTHTDDGDADQTAEAFARELAEADSELALELVRDHFNGK